MTFKNGVLTILLVAQEALTITEGPKTVTYGDAAFTLKTTGGSGTGAVTWSAEGAAAVNEKGEVTITGAGAVTITATKAADGNHTAAVSAAYQAALYLGTTQISNAVTVESDGSCTMSYYTKAQLLPTGTNTLTLRYVGTHNMADAVATVNVTIAPKPVTLLAENQTKNYGEKDPTFTYTVTGLEGNDTLNGTLTREEGEDVKDGGYAITQGTLTNANNQNYSITYTPGTLMIHPIAQQALTLTGMPAAVTYGDAPFTLRAMGGSGKSEVTWTADGPATVDAAGTVTITGAGAVTITATKTTDGNYTEAVTASVTIQVVPKALVWDPAELTVTTEKHWDDNANAAVSGIVKVAGMVGADDPGFSYTEAIAVYDSAKEGSHTITVTVKDANLTNGNYTLPTALYMM